MKIDTHVHSIIEKPHPVMSCDEMVDMAVEMGLDGFILTEHNKLLPEKEFQALRENKASLKIFRGIEVGCLDGLHYLIYGPLRFWPLDGETTPRNLVKIAHEDGNFVSIAHPYRSNMTDPNPDWKIPEHVYEMDIDGIEVKSFNLHNTVSQEKSLQLAELLNCVAMAGSDHHPHCPRIGKIGVKLENAVETDEELVGALKSGRLSRFDCVDF